MTWQSEQSRDGSLIVPIGREDNVECPLLILSGIGFEPAACDTE